MTRYRAHYFSFSGDGSPVNSELCSTGRRLRAFELADHCLHNPGKYLESDPMSDPSRGIDRVEVVDSMARHGSPQKWTLKLVAGSMEIIKTESREQ